MANTETIQNTVNWTAAYLEQQPVKINGLEPALGAANLVLQTVLGPPFSWPFNRGIITYVTAGQDHTEGGLNDFGFLEGGSVKPPVGNPYDVVVRNLLQPDANQARPMFVSPLFDDGAGNIAFRLTPAPTDNSIATLLYQKKAAPILSLGFTWFPVPDEKNYICKWGFLALMSLIGNDARFGQYNQKFVTGLLAAQGGLSAMERNLFIANWTAVIKDLQGAQLSTSERFKAREV